MKEHTRLYRERYFKENPHKLRAKQDRERKNRLDYPEKFMVRQAKSRAKSAGLPFNLLPTDIHIPKVCPVLKIKLVSGVGAGRALPGSASLDRLIPELGYTRGNVLVTSWRANELRRDATMEEMEKIVRFYRKVLNGRQISGCGSPYAGRKDR